MPTPTAHEVATAFRQLADSLDRNPDAPIKKPWISFYCDDKQAFANVVKLLPRPLVRKEESGDDRWARIKVEHVTAVIDVNASIPKSLTCELVEPARAAVYRCDPVLSLLEEGELVGSASASESEACDV